jgi:acyl carrier protein
MFTFEEFRDKVKSSIKKIMKKKDEVVIGDDEDFSDYGLDSLSSFSLVLEIESAFGIDLGELDLEDSNTIRLFYNKTLEIIEESQ